MLHRLFRTNIFSGLLWVCLNLLFVQPCNGFISSEINSTSPTLGIFSGIDHFTFELGSRPVFYPASEDAIQITTTEEDIVYSITAGQDKSPGYTGVDGYFLYTKTNPTKPFEITMQYHIEASDAKVGLFVVGLILRDDQNNMIMFDYAWHYDYQIGGFLIDQSKNGGPISIDSIESTMFSRTFSTSYYMRLRYFPANHYITFDYSKDGQLWSSLAPVKFEFQTEPVVGPIFISKDTDEQSIQCSFHNIDIKPLQTLYGERKITQKEDGSLLVNLDLYNDLGEYKEINYQESITGFGDILEVFSESENYTITVNHESNTELDWDITLPPGKTTLQYHWQPDENRSHEIVSFNGLTTEITVFGDNVYHNELDESVEYSSMKWRKWNVDQGLPDSITRQISQGSDGNLYTYHEPGILSRFDGYRFENIPFPENVNGYVKAGIGNSLWYFDTSTSHLYWLESALDDQKQWQICKISDGSLYENQDVLTTIFIHRVKFAVTSRPILKNYLMPIDQHKILILTPTQLSLYDAKNSTEKILLTPSATDIGYYCSLYLSSNGSVWLSGEKGILKLHDIETPTIQNTYTFPKSFPFIELLFPVENANEDLLFLTKHQHNLANYLIEFNGQEFIPKYLSQRSLMPISFGNYRFWVNEWDDHFGTSFSGISEILPDQLQQIKPYGISDDLLIWDNEEHEKNSFWLATNQGLMRYTPPLWNKVNTITEPIGFVSSITEDAQGSLWFLSERFLISYHQDQWKQYPLPPISLLLPDKSQVLNPLPDGRLIYAANSVYGPNNLVVFDPKTEDFSPLKHPQQRGFEHVAPANNGDLFTAVWAGGLDLRIEKYSNGNFETIINSLESLGTRTNKLPNGLMFIYQTENEDLWLGSNTNKPMLWFRDGKQQNFPENQSYPGKAVFSILEVDDGIIWVGGLNSIYQFDGKQWTLVKTGLDHVPSMIKAIDGSIWIASWSGVQRFENGVWIKHENPEGLNNSSVNEIYQDREGDIWIGAMDGIYKFDSIADTDPPTTWFEEDNLDVFASDGDVRIFFDGLDRWKHTEKERLYYSWRMNGEEWSPFKSEKQVAFSNLSPGQHQIEVKAMDRKWNVDPSPAVFEFKVLSPPIQEQEWFLAVVVSVMLIILLLALFAYISKEKLAHFSKNLQAMVEERTRQLKQTQGHLLNISEREQQRIGQDLHDDVVQELVGIAMHSELLKEELTQYSPKSIEELDHIMKRVDSATFKTRTLARGLSPVNLDKLGLVGALQSLTAGIEQNSHIECQLQCDKKININTHNQRLNLYRIAQESIMNAHKHSQTSIIQISLKQQNNSIQLVVQDNGIGFNVHEFADGMGLQILKYRAENINADLEIVSKPGKGTTVRCTLPLEQKQ